MIRYWLMQLPATLAVVLTVYVVWRLVDLPVWLAWAVVATWVLMDVGLFFLVWRSYDPDLPGRHSLAGEIGTAVDGVADTGFVRVRGELWRGHLTPGARAVAGGERVRVISVSGLTLHVAAEEPDTSADSPPPQ